MLSAIQLAAQQIRQGVRAATEGLVGREQLAELIVLAAVAQEHLLVVGPPGTAKSAVERRGATRGPGHGRALFRIPAGAFHRTL